MTNLQSCKYVYFQEFLKGKHIGIAYLCKNTHRRIFSTQRYDLEPSTIMTRQIVTIVCLQASNTHASTVEMYTALPPVNNASLWRGPTAMSTFVEKIRLTCKFIFIIPTQIRKRLDCIMNNDFSCLMINYYVK